MRLVVITLVVLSSLLSASMARASITLDISSLDDLSNLSVGQTVTINVVLSGLVAGDELTYLAATVGFDPLLLGTPLGVVAGPIVPDPTTPAFVTAIAAGLADGNYIGLASNITTNGVFYSFDVTVVQPGAGAIEFQFVDSDGFNGSNPLPLVLAGSSILYTTPPTGPEVPEPASLAIWGTMSLGAASIATLRRRRLIRAKLKNGV